MFRLAEVKTNSLKVPCSSVQQMKRNCTRQRKPGQEDVTPGPAVGRGCSAGRRRQKLGGFPVMGELWKGAAGLSREVSQGDEAVRVC